MVESGADEILRGADSGDVAFCVVGDPFGATTHSDLQLRAREAGVEVKIVHNASVLNAVGAAGLQLYRYGEAVSLCFHSATWKPDSWHDRIRANRERGLHTLCLLDIKVKEQTDESLASGGKKLRYHPPRFMTATHAAKQLLEVEGRKKSGAYDENTTAVALARLGSEDQAIVVATLGEFARAGEAEEAAAAAAAAVASKSGDDDENKNENENDNNSDDEEKLSAPPLPGVESAAATAAADALLKRPLGGPLHSLVIAGEIHAVEAELLDTFR